MRAASVKPKASSARTRRSMSGEAAIIAAVSELFGPPLRIRRISRRRRFAPVKLRRKRTRARAREPVVPRRMGSSASGMRSAGPRIHVVFGRAGV